MRAELVVGAGAALLIGALAGMEWWAEHRMSAPEAVASPVEGADAGLPTVREIEEPVGSASPRLSR